MYTYSLSDFDSTRNPAPQPGSLADLVGLAQGRPIYCTPSPAALMNVVIGSFHRDCPAAEFVDALALYRNYNWDRRWASERKRFGAAIIVTRAEYLPQGTDRRRTACDQFPSRRGDQGLHAPSISCRLARGRVPRVLLANPVRRRAIQSAFQAPLRDPFGQQTSPTSFNP